MALIDWRHPSGPNNLDTLGNRIWDRAPDYTISSTSLPLRQPLGVIMKMINIINYLNKHIVSAFIFNYSYWNKFEILLTHLGYNNFTLACLLFTCATTKLFSRSTTGPLIWQRSKSLTDNKSIFLILTWDICHSWFRRCL